MFQINKKDLEIKHSSLGLLVSLALLFFVILLLTPAEARAEVGDVSINPELDISRFAPYKIFVENVPSQDDVSSVSLELKALNGNSVPTDCWDYFIDGVCDSQILHYNLTYNLSETRWETKNIYPDQIYPETFFAPSSITWNNTPINKTTYRESYEIFKFNNNFDMVGDMSLWVELDAAPRSSNSSNLEVYLASNQAVLSTFDSDWRNSPLVEEIAAFDNSSVFHHTHSSNSSHHLISLQTNADGSIGTKNLEIDNTFWILLYSKSPNIKRGWDLKYHPSSICDHSNRWYKGNRFGWTISEMSGCPDVHTHIARRSDNMDGVNAFVTVTYDDESSETENSDFFFGPLPNIAPNPTSFTKPYEGGAFDGLMRIEWDPSSDANNDNLSYTIDLLNSNEVFLANLATDTSNTFLDFDTTLFDDNPYLLRGEVCDDGTPSLCTGFLADNLFYIYNSGQIASAIDITISSTNKVHYFAKAQDSLSLTFTVNSSIELPEISMFSGGYDLTNNVNLEEVSPNTWVASVEISKLDRDGYVSFNIISANLDKTYSLTTDESFVYIDNTPPGPPLANQAQGSYSESIIVELESQDAYIIRYTVNGDVPSCTSGLIYSSEIEISNDVALTTVACDEAGNSSEVITYQYYITNTELPVTGDDISIWFFLGFLGVASSLIRRKSLSVKSM